MEKIAEAAKPRRKRSVKAAQLVLSVAITVGIFALIIPKITHGYGGVWRSISGLTPAWLTVMVLAMIFNLFTYWWQMMAAMPGLTIAQAAVNNQTGTTISNIIPAGGVIALGVVVEMFRSWGFSRSAIGLEITLTGIWNSFLKLGLPVIALAAVAITGHAAPTLLVPALVGLAILAGSAGLFALALWKKQFARSIGDRLGAAWSWVRRLFRKLPVTAWGDAAVRFRHEAIDLVARRWIQLSFATVLSHLALYSVLLLSLRAMGVTNGVVGWAEVLAVFSLGRLVTALPLTPGGVGLVEFTYILGLDLIGKKHVDVPYEVFVAQVAAAVLIFRLLTYGIQIPLGGFTYVIWRRKKSWLKSPPPNDAGTLALEAAPDD